MEFQSRRDVLKLLGIAGVGAAAAACGFGATGTKGASGAIVSAAEPTQPITIEFWRRNYAKGGVNADSITTDAAIAAFQRRYPNITVVPVGDPVGPATNQKYDIAILQQGAGPDVFSSTGPELTKYAKAGKLAVPDVTDRGAYDTAVIEASLVNNQLAGYPLWVVPWFQYINPTQFKEAGIATPPSTGWTIDSFQEATRALTGGGKHGWAFYSTDYSFMINDGARPVNSEQTKWTFSSPDAASSLNRWGQIVKDGGAAPGVVSFAYADSVNVFKNGSVGILQNPSALATELIGSDEWTYGTNWDVVASPVGKVAQTTWGALGYVGVLAQDNAEKVAAAQLFGQYISGPEIGEDLKATNVQWWQAPAAMLTARSAFADYHPSKAKIASFLDGEVYIQPNLQKWTQIDTQYLGPARDSVITGQESAETALDRISTPAQQLVDS